MTGERRDAPIPRYLYRRANHDSAADRAFVQGLLAEYVAHENTGDDATKRYQWLYRDNPHGQALTFLAFDPDAATPVGLTSLFPRRVMATGREVVGAIGGDGYVTPSHRRRGIVTALHREAMEAMRDGSVAFMFGPPEPNNLRALVKAGAKVTGAVERLARPLASDGLGHEVSRWLGPSKPLVDRLLRPRASRLRVVPLGGEPDARVDRVFRDMADARPDDVTPVGDAAFFAWRYDRSPSGLQRGYLLLDGDVPVAAVALERRDGSAALLDVVTTTRWKRAAHAACAAMCKGDRVLHIELHVPAPRERALLFTGGFVPRAEKAFQVQVPAEHPLAATLTRPDAWKYAWGDGDVDHVL